MNVELILGNRTVEVAGWPAIPAAWDRIQVESPELQRQLGGTLFAVHAVRWVLASPGGPVRVQLIVECERAFEESDDE